MLEIIFSIACNTGLLERSYSRLTKMCHKDRNHSVQGSGSPLGFWKNFGSTLFLPPSQTWKFGSLLLYPKVQDTFCAQNLHNYGILYRYQCKNILYYHLKVPPDWTATLFDIFRQYSALFNIIQHYSTIFNII